MSKTKKNNTVITEDNIEIYQNKIFELTDIFLDNEYNGNIPEKINFKYLITWLSLNLKIHTYDIHILDQLFDCYIVLCNKYNYNPTIEQFRQLVNLNSKTFYNWSTGTTNKASNDYAEITKKWIDICKGSLINDLSNNDKTSVNKIYITKAVYGMAETTPTNENTAPGRYISTDNLPVLSVSQRQPEDPLELSDNL